MPIAPQKIEKNKRNLVEWKDIYREALYYYNAVKILEENSITENLFPPILTNASFACELFSKAIICNKNKKLEKCKGHSLKDLYSKFPDDIKKVANEKYDNGNECRFERFIDEISDFFEIWRYRYEYCIRSAHYDFLLKYMEVLKQITDELS